MRAAIFIDGAYVDQVLRRHHAGTRIAYDKLAQSVTGDSDLLRTYYYDAPPWQNDPPTEDERRRFASKQRFFSALSKLPKFQVRQGRCARYWDKDRNGWRFQQKRVDVLCSVDLVRLASKGQIQRAILIGGDSDFLPAVVIAKDEGVLVELLHSPDLREVHRDLWDTCDERRKIDAALVNSILR